DSYMGGVARAWRFAEQAYDQGDAPLALGLQCRYAIVTASLNSLASAVPVPLLMALVTHGVWPVVRGLTVARQIPHSAQRVAARAALAPHLEGAKREAALAQALEAARGLRYEEPRVTALAALAPHLEGAEREAALAQELEAARGLGNEWHRARAL